MGNRPVGAGGWNIPLPLFPVSAEKPLSLEYPHLPALCSDSLAESRAMG